MDLVRRFPIFVLCALLFACKDETVMVVPVAAVDVEGPSTVLVGEGAQFTAVPRDDRGNRLTARQVSWTTNNGSLATVTSGGLVAGVLGGEVTVSASCEGRSGSAALTVNNPVPVVTSTDPSVATAGSAGLQLRVLGSGFVATSVVRWNESDRVTTYVSGTEVRATLTAADLGGAGTHQVTVLNPAPGGGTSANRPLTVSNPVPVVTSFTPSGVTMGSGDLTVTVRGTGFVATSKVVWLGGERTTTYVSGTELRATIPAADLTTPGFRTVRVSNPGPGGGESGGKAFPVRIPVVGPFAGAADYQSCALSLEGQAYCWGYNGRGQLGDGTTSHRAQPVAVTGAPRLVAVDEGPGHGCGLDEVGRAWCWGANEYGQLGDGSHTDRAQAWVVGAGASFLTLSVGGAHACGIKMGGKAFCWGRNHMGQLGDGSTADQTQPVAVDQGALVFRTISAGTEHTCADTGAGQVYCWGRGDEGQLGEGSANRRSSPVLVVGLTDIHGVTAGTYHSCAWRESGPGYCWGRGTEGQLGDGSFTSKSTPVSVSPVSDFADMSAWGGHTCGITGGGDVHCWGLGYDGQLGNGGRRNQNQAVRVPAVPPSVAIVTGGMHSCAITSSHQAHCWGNSRFGQLGNGETPYRLSPEGVALDPSSFAVVSTGIEFTCGSSAVGLPYCWGRNDGGQLGNGTQDDRSSPALLNTGQHFATLSTGGQHSCGLTALGQAYCWGKNQYGQLGNGSTAGALSPGAVAGGHTFLSIGVGGEHTCGVDGGGNVYCWGRNDFGQLGDGSTTHRSLPTPINTGVVGLVFQTVAAGLDYSCAATPWGSLFCWGRNAFGQLGDGSTVNRTAPVQVPGLTGIVAVSLGGAHSCALDASGEAYCWGYAGYGQLGIGSQVNHDTPQAVSGGHTFRSIHASYHHTCAVTTGNQGFCWGDNSWGQLGDGTFNWRNTPMEIAGGLSWAMIGSGGGQHHTCGVSTVGVAYCWGVQWSGELGNGKWGVELEPVQVIGGVSFGVPVSPVGSPPGLGRRTP